MRSTKRLAAVVAALAVAMAVAYGVITSPGPRTSAGVSSSPGRMEARKAGGGPSGTPLEYRNLAIPGVRGTGGGAG
jgi:hypothetical protein